MLGEVGHSSNPKNDSNMICSNCRSDKEDDCFYKRKDRKRGYTSWCIDCLKMHADKYKERSKASRRLRDFNCTQEQYDKMYSDQEGKCYICGRDEDEIQQNSLCVDHDHVTFKIRGLLCHDCNVGLGRFKDSQRRLMNAVNYLMGVPFSNN